MNTTAGRAPTAPIGLLLRRLDRLISERFERTLGAGEITRRQWQLLSTLADGDVPLDVLTAAVAPFLDQAAGETAKQHLEPLVVQGLVRDEGEVYTLSEAGRACFENLSVEVQVTRDLTVAGLGEGDYERVISALQVMIANLTDDA